MASITKIERKKGTVYKVLVRLKGHPSISQSFDRRSEAIRWVEDTEYALRNGGYIGNAPAGDMLFEDALTRYLAEVSSQKAKSTHRREIYQARSLVFFNGKKLGEITPADTAAYRDARAKVVGPAMVRKDLNILSHLFNVAKKEWALVVSNPVEGIRKPKTPQGRLRFLTREEIASLLDESKQSHRRLLYEYIVLQLNTGMRPSEGAGITWQQVNLDQRIIDLTETKTDPRRVPLTVSAVEVLASIMPRQDCTPHDYVFLPKNPKMTFRQRPNQYFRESFEAAVSRAKITDFHMHDLRHTAASHMVMSGIDIRTIADILGHKTISMTMKYTHLLDTYKVEAVDRLGI